MAAVNQYSGCGFAEMHQCCPVGDIMRTLLSAREHDGRKRAQNMMVRDDDDTIPYYFMTIYLYER